MDSNSIFTPGSTNRAYDLPIFITPGPTPTPGGATNTPGPSPTPTATPTVDYAVTTPDTPTTVPTVNTPTATPTGPTPTHTVTPSRTLTVTPAGSSTATPTITPTSTPTPSPTPYYTTTPESCTHFGTTLACYDPGDLFTYTGCYNEGNYLTDNDLAIFQVITVPEGEEWIISGIETYAHCYTTGVNTCQAAYSLDLSISLDVVSPWDGIPPFLFTDRISGADLTSYNAYYNNHSLPPYAHTFATPVPLSSGSYTFYWIGVNFDWHDAMGILDLSASDYGECTGPDDWYWYDAMVYSSDGDLYYYEPPYTPLGINGEGRVPVP